MANIRKSFSFRNGVQVDDDDLVVRSNLVGIGTTVPTETLDVRGTTKLVGFTTMIGDLQVSGVSTFANKVAIGTQVSISGGIITATAFFGNGATLSNLPTSQWIDVDAGLGFTSIYVQGNVGVGTTDPRRLMQIGGNPDLSQTGTVFDIKGNLYSTGIVTATSFVGFGSGITEINASNVATGTLGTSRLPIIPNDRLAPDIAVSGIITASGGFSGTLTGSLIGNVTGNVTGIATTARGLIGTPDIIVGVVTATTVSSGSLISSGIVSTSTLTVGASGTSLTVNGSGKIGIGSAIPSADLQLFRSETARVEVISNTGEASISVGNSIGVGNSTTVLRFGNAQSTFEILNRSTGSINNYIHAGGTGVGTGNFNWIYGQSNSELMTLTYGGNLGVGKTNPTHKLHVAGTSTVTNDAFFGADVIIAGTITAGTFDLPLVLDGSNINILSGISTFNDILVNDDLFVNGFIGIATNTAIVPLDVRGQTGLFGSIGINTSLQYTTESLVVGGTILGEKIGIGTTVVSQADIMLSGNVEWNPSPQADTGYINIRKAEIYLDNQSLVGIGTTTTPNSAVDFSNAGAGIPGNIARQMIVPRVSSAERAGIRTERGGIVYNTTLNELQGAVQVGTGNTQWVNLGITTAIVETNQINVSGVSTFAGITTVTGPTLFGKQVNVSGVSTFNNTVRIGTGVTIQSGIVTATSGFLSGIGTAVQITTVGNTLVFTVPGVGSTSFTLF